MPGEAAERTPRLRTDDAVDGDAGVDLEAADRLRGPRTLDPVDRAGIEPTRVQADLEGGHARIGHGALGGGESRDEDEGQNEKRPDVHGVVPVRHGVSDPLTDTSPRRMSDSARRATRTAGSSITPASTLTGTCIRRPSTGSLACSKRASVARITPSRKSGCRAT